VQFPNWHRRLLQAMGIVPTNSRLDFLAAWAQAEGGTARFNPLNTTEKVPGSKAYNSAGVQHYSDALQGIAATLLTLRLHYYDRLRAALAADGISALEILSRSTSDVRTWGTNPNTIRRVLGG